MTTGLRSGGVPSRLHSEARAGDETTQNKSGLSIERRKSITISAKKLLDRDVSVAMTREVRDVGRPVLREIVEEGIRVFERCSATAPGADENIGLLFPFLQLIEMLDATEIELDGSGVVGSNLLLRAGFEALLTTEWVARDKDLRYGAAYLVSDIHRRISEHQKYYDGHERRRQLLAAIEADDSAIGVFVPTMPDASAKIAGLEELLTEPHLAEAEKEYQLARKKLKHPRFHSFWNGPRSIEQLAKKLARGAQYEILYRQWSLTGHADDVMRQLSHLDGVPALRPFRNGEGLSNAYGFAINFGLSGMRAVLGFYRPAELDGSFRAWYIAQIREGNRRLTDAPG
jgi:hypothetical protein